MNFAPIGKPHSAPIKNERKPVAETQNKRFAVLSKNRGIFIFPMPASNKRSEAIINGNSDGMIVPPQSSKAFLTAYKTLLEKISIKSNHKMMRYGTKRLFVPVIFTLFLSYSFV